MNAPRRRIYLDHAATSWPKSEAVMEAMDCFQRQCGAAAGRGGYRSAVESDKTVNRVRRSLARLIGASDPQSVSLHSSGTDALNAAIHGIVRPNDHVVTSAAEHNSVLRPLHQLRKRNGIRLTVVPTDQQGRVDANAIVDSITDQTRLVTLTHASNVSGAVQPITEVGQAIQNEAAFFLCDAAQTFGTIPIDVQESGIDLLAAPGHKSSGGPLGTGFLYVSPRAQAELVPHVQGGTGSQSESLEMPGTMPSMLEAGNLNVPALAGWAVALEQLLNETVASRAEQARRLAKQLHEGLETIEHVNAIFSGDALPIVSLTLDGLSPTDAALILDTEYGVETRAGLHCAALIHEHLGTQPEGTLRISAGHSTTPDDIEMAIAAVHSIVAAIHAG